MTVNHSNYRKSKKGRFSADLGAVAVIARNVEFLVNCSNYRKSQNPSKPKKRQLDSFVR